MFGVQFNVGLSRDAIARALAQIADMTPVYQDIGEYLVESHRKRFLAGESPQGVKWAPKSQTTLDRYKRLGYGNLTRPLIGPSKQLSRQILKFVQKDGVVIGSNLEYAAVMQDGAARGAFGADRHGRPIPWGRIPARAWLGLSDADEKAVIDIVEEHLEIDSGA